MTINLLVSFTAHACPENFTCSHALTLVDTPKYSADAAHTGYVNPDAPKGGAVKLLETGSYDSFNPFVVKGIAAAGIGGIYDTLMADSLDEASVEYGLLAKEVQVAKDNSSVRFILREEAKFHDGHPITAEDVVFTFNTLMEKGKPYYKAYYGDVKEVKALDTHAVEFTFKTTENRELPLILGQLPVLPKHFYSPSAQPSSSKGKGAISVDFEKDTLAVPLGSGPYALDAFEPGKWVRYKRVPDYWAKDHFLNVGMDNFDTIQYDYYRDETVAIEALKAGELDFRQENIAKNWATAYNIPEVESGDMVKETLPNGNPTGMQAFAYNLRKEKFSDRRLREALSYAFDFEWANKNIFFDSYTRTQSFFSNSPMASGGLPGEAEKALLEPLKEKIPPEVFTAEYHAPATGGTTEGVRDNLRKAKELLEQAGWVVKEGKRVHGETGEPLTLEFLLYSPTFERVVGPFIQNLKRLGVEASIRTVDPTQYIKRVQQFDFDIIVHSFAQSTSPGNEQIDYWHSSKADQEGSRNVIGIKNPAVDALVEKIVQAKGRDELITACRALDRVLLHEHYVIPQYHSRDFRIIYWNRFGKPSVQPVYSVGFDSWWIDEAKAEKLREKLGR